jgi:hypothetical protein
MAAQRNRLMPWYVGLVIIVGVVAYTGYQMVVGSCAAPTIPKLGVLFVMPGVYLVLMYLTLVSQK